LGVSSKGIPFRIRRSKISTTEIMKLSVASIVAFVALFSQAQAAVVYHCSSFVIHYMSDFKLN
jgi:hypothetical protein